MKRYFILGCAFWVLLFNNGISQETPKEHKFYTEAPIEFRDGVLYSNQITIGFKDHSVIQNLRGRERINGNQVHDGKFKASLSSFCRDKNLDMRDIIIKRGIPSWPLGKTTITNRITGQLKSAACSPGMRLLDFVCPKACLQYSFT